MSHAGGMSSSVAVATKGSSIANELLFRCGTYLLQYIDKQSLSYAAVFDLFTSTNTNQTQYSWLVSIFYFG